MMRRTISVGLAAMFAAVSPAQAATPDATQTFPNRPMRVVVPQPPGGTIDTNARALSEQLSRALGQTIVIENRGGANGIIAGETVAKALPDGHTLLYSSNSFVNNQLVYKKLPFDVTRDFAPVTRISKLLGYLVVIRPQLQVQTLKELLAAGRDERQPIKYGSGGIGNSQHLLGELFNTRGGSKMIHVPYKGLPLIITGVLSNEVDVAFAPPTTVLSHVGAGRLRPVAFTGQKRFSALPNVPTAGETLPGFVFESAWLGMFAPGGTPPAMLNRLHGEIAKAMAIPKLREFYESGGYAVLVESPAEFRNFLKAYLRETAEHMRIAKVEPE